MKHKMPTKKNPETQNCYLQLVKEIKIEGKFTLNRGTRDFRTSQSEKEKIRLSKRKRKRRVKSREDKTMKEAKLTFFPEAKLY